MSFQLGFMDLAGLIGAGAGAWWIVLQVAGKQFMGKLELQFAAQGERIGKLETVAVRIQAFEVDSAKRETAMALHYVLREEYRIDHSRLEKQLDQIFELLREMNEKLDKKVDRIECIDRMGKK